MRSWLLGLVVTMVALPCVVEARGCFPLAGGAGVQVASTEFAAVPEGKTVVISYLGHSSFLIETPSGTRAITDYNGYMTTATPPDVATMNNAHDTHFTAFPDPSIEHVLEGWGAGNSMAVHDVEIEDLRVRNIPTSVHGRAGAQANSNSIFVFEIEDLCIAHLGHLHHVLTDTHLGELGVIDILLVPIDGAYTMSQREMAFVVEQIRPSIVIPMHYFGDHMVDRFAALLSEKFVFERATTSSVALSRLDLRGGRFLVLPPGPG